MGLEFGIITMQIFVLALAIIISRVILAHVIRSFEKSQSQARMKRRSTKPKRRRRRVGKDRKVANEVPRIPLARKLSSYCPLKKPAAPALRRQGSASSLKSVRWDRKKEELTYFVF